MVIPTFDRVGELEETLDSLFEQRLHRMEVLIVDNGPSTDDTAAAMRRRSAADRRLRYLRTARKGVTWARSIGNHLARYEMVLQMDDDVTIPDPRLLERLAACLAARPEVDVLGVLELKDRAQAMAVAAAGRSLDVAGLPTIDRRGDTGIGTISDRFDLTTGFERLAEMEPALWKIDSFRSCFMLFRRGLVDRVGQWDLNYLRVGGSAGIREETDFLLRCRRRGAGIYYTNASAIWHRGAYRSAAGRGTRGRRGFFYAAAHAYMVTKYLVEDRSWHRLRRWIPAQFLRGGLKNPGLSYALRRDGLAGLPWNAAGFTYGLLSGLFRRRRFLPAEPAGPSAIPPAARLVDGS